MQATLLEVAIGPGSPGPAGAPGPLRLTLRGPPETPPKTE